MTAAKDLTGQIFGELKVLRMERTPSKQRAWVCECSCGTITKPIKTANLGNGNTTKCNQHPFVTNLTGNIYGKLTVLGYSHTQQNVDDKGKIHSKVFWQVECECGNIKSVRGDILQSKLKSCGCNHFIQSN